MEVEYFNMLAMLAGKCSQFLINEERQQYKRRILAQRAIVLANTLLYKNLIQKVRAKRKRSIWSKQRNSCWWTEIVLKKFNDRDWVNNFRIDKTTFNQICAMVRADLKPKPTKLKPREPISVEKKVAVALYKFAWGAEYRVIGTKMGISTCSVHKCIRLFTTSMLKHVQNIIKMPTENEAERIAKKFESICHIPQILLLIDNTHIPISAPKEGHDDFVNRQGWTSYNVQIVADADYIIRDVSCRYPGASHDAQVFKNSGFFQYIHDLLPKKTKIINGVKVNYLVLGDPAYPLFDWLLKGYTGNLDPLQESFNVYMNYARIIVEQTIRKLKSRWHILNKVNEMDYKFIPKIVIVCCMLHNILQTRKKPFLNIIEVEEISPLNMEQPNMQDMTRTFSTANTQGEVVRNAIRSITDSLPIRKQIVN